MHTVGIICEYNPLHAGHENQFRKIREFFGADTAVVCLMSGNYVQRGAPAIFDKSLRAQAAVLSGADLVLELPTTAALSSAEGFADAGIRILTTCCDTVSFGTESMSTEAMFSAAHALLSPEFSAALRLELESGISFPAARQRALEQLGCSLRLTNPNDILGTEYCKAILAQNSKLKVFQVPRDGSYHASSLDLHAPSATAVRKAILEGTDWLGAVPEPARNIFSNAPIHHLAFGNRAVLAKLRTMDEAAFEALPYGSEGLWRKLMHASREQNDLSAIVDTVKSKRYTRTRIDRMILCAFLGITREMMAMPIPYVRVLAMNDNGRAILRSRKDTGFFRNAGQKDDSPYWKLEQNCGALYGLFAHDQPDLPNMEEKRRMIYLPSEKGGTS